MVEYDQKFYFTRRINDDIRKTSLQMTVEVVAGAEDCFYLPDLNVSQTIEMEFQVGNKPSLLIDYNNNNKNFSKQLSFKTNVETSFHVI
jgi:hypothetical protein